MNLAADTWAFFSDPAHWSGAGSIPTRVAEQAGYTALAVAVAAAVGLPLGLATGHARRGGTLVPAVANAARSLPTLGLLVLMVVLLGTSLVPVLVPLVVLAIPPILLNTDAGVRGVDPRTADAARGIGLTRRQVVLRVELPAALPLVLVGFRSAAVQTAATATIAAQVSFGGIGRFIIDGLAVRDYRLVVGGSVLSALFAVAVIAFFAVLGRLLVPRGVRLARRPGDDR